MSRLLTSSLVDAVAPLSFISSPPREFFTLRRRHLRCTLRLSSLFPPPPLRSSSYIVQRPSFSDLRWSTRSHFRRLSCTSPPAAATSANGALLVRDAGATAAVIASAYALISVFNILTDRGLIEQSLSRKLVHILSGLLFMVSWPVFSTAMEARYFASFVPLVNCFRLVFHGLSLAPSDEGLLKSVTREGSPGELLRGPLYYVLTLITCSLVFWRESPVGVISLAMMCGGDGVADIMGRRFGTLKIPYNKQKSWAGSISMLGCGFLISMLMLYYFSMMGYFQLDWGLMMGRVAVVSIVATIVESLPITDSVDDNISVPLVSMITAFFIFR